VEDKIMKIKILDALSAKCLEKKVNEFIENNNFKIIDMQFSVSFGTFAIMIRYENS
jgi:hypothetical protein